MCEDMAYEELLNYTKEQKISYLRGLADGEGWPAFYRDKTTRGHHKQGYANNRSICISNTDLQLLEKAQQLLESLGIISKIYKDSVAGTRKATKDSWKLTILGKENMQIFADLVGFTNPEKEDKLRNMMASYREHGS